MNNKNDILKCFEKAMQALPQALLAETNIQFDYHNPIHGDIDVILFRNGACIALGRFCAVDNQKKGVFSDRFKMAMGYPGEPWYLFDFDGNTIVFNDLSYNVPVDEKSNDIERTLRRLLTLPVEWRTQRTQQH